VFILILVLILFWFGLSLLMAAGTLFLQGYFNETPPDLKELLWRAPAAAGGVAVFALVWAILAYNAFDNYAPLTDFSATEVSQPFPKLTVVEQGKKTQYRLTKGERGRPIYRDSAGRPLPTRPFEEIIVKEDDHDTVFKPERDAKGKLKRERGRGLRYVDDKGRFMEGGEGEGYMGYLSVSHPGRTFVYVVLNLVHGAVWVACLWLLLRFSLGQALLLAVCCWLAMTLLVLPPILILARDRARAAAQPSQNGKREDHAGPPSFAITSLRGRPRYLEATDAGKLMLTFVSSPARTATFSVRVSVLPSRTTSAVSV
jgi:hypothetical protein